MTTEQSIELTAARADFINQLSATHYIELTRISEQFGIDFNTLIDDAMHIGVENL